MASGVKTSRPGLQKALDRLRQGDTFVVWKLDRLGRSVSHLIETIQGFNQQQIGFRSLQENIDTTTSGGKLIFHMFSALAEFERDLIKERTEAGLKAARKRGRLGGRPPRLRQQEVEKLTRYYKKGDLPISELCRIFDISKPTLYRYLKVSPNSTKTQWTGVNDEL